MRRAHRRSWERCARCSEDVGRPPGSITRGIGALQTDLAGAAAAGRPSCVLKFVRSVAASRQSTLNQLARTSGLSNRARCLARSRRRFSFVRASGPAGGEAAAENRWIRMLARREPV